MIPKSSIFDTIRAMHQKLKNELMAAMKNKETLRVTVIRSLLAAFTNELVAKGRKPQEEVTDDEALAVIKRAAKQRKDSIEQFRKGGREDLAVIEEAELKVIEAYLPTQMSREEVKKIARALKEKLGVTDKSKIGMFMGAVMKKLKGRADGTVVKEIVDSLIKDSDL